MFNNMIPEEILCHGELYRELFPLSTPGENKAQCLADTEVTELLDHVLPQNRLDSALFHLAVCDDCLELVILSHKALHPEATSPLESFTSIIGSCFDRLRRYVLVIRNSAPNLNPTVLAPGFRIAPFPAPSMVRGLASKKKPNKVVLEKEAASYLFRIELERVAPKKNQLEIMAREKSTGRPADLRLTLRQEGNETDSYMTQEGRVVFEDMSQGRYRVLVSKKAVKVCEFDFSLV